MSKEEKDAKEPPMIGGIEVVVHKKNKKKKHVVEETIVEVEQKPKTILERIKGDEALVEDIIAWRSFLVGAIAGVIFPVFYVIFAEIIVTNIQLKTPSEVAATLPNLFYGENFWSFSLFLIAPIIMYSLLITLCTYYLVLSQKLVAFAGLFMIMAGPPVMLILGLFTITH